MPYVFLSHSTIDDTFVTNLAQKLQQSGIDVFCDHFEINAGNDWTDKVGGALQTCNHMIAVMSSDSIASKNCRDEWNYFIEQNREVIPILIRNFDQKEIYFRLVSATWIDMRDMSRFDQVFKTLLQNITDDKKPIYTNVPAKPSVNQTASDQLNDALYSLYKIKRAEGKAVGIATGNIALIPGVDVLVNSENDQLHMDRARPTVSSALNKFGAIRDAQGKPVKWILEKELEDECERLKIPVRALPATIVTTSAGNLIGNGIRHIIHTVAVYLLDGDGHEAVSEVELRMCVHNVLAECEQLNNEKYLPAGEPPLKKVVFPILASGDGRKDFEKTSKLLIERAIEYFIYHPDTLVENVYFTAYTPKQLTLLEEVMKGMVVTPSDSVPALLEAPIRHESATDRANA